MKYAFSLRQCFCIPQLKVDEIKKSLYNFGSILAQFSRVRNYWWSPAGSPDTPLALQAKMVGWQSSENWI